MKFNVTRFLNSMIAAPSIRSDGQIYYKYDHDRKVWAPIPPKEVLREIRKVYFCGQYEADTAANARQIRDEIQSSERFYFPMRERKSSPYIVMKMGRLDVLTKKVEPVRQEDYETNYVDFQYLPDATWEQAPVFCGYAKSSLGISLTETELSPKRKLLMEILTYAVSSLFGAKKMIILLGPSNCGKTVLLGFLRAVCPRYTSLSLQDLTSQFRGSAIMKVPLVLNDEMGVAGIRRLDLLKKIISGEALILEAKREEPVSYTPHVKLIYAANALPSLSEYDAENAFASRLQVLQFGNAIPREQWDLKLVDKIVQERNVILSIAIRESGNFVQTLNFTKDPESERVIEAYKADNDSVRAFTNDTAWCVQGESKRVYTARLHDAYTEYCQQNGLSAVKVAVFRTQLSQLGFKHDKGRINGGKPLSRTLGISLKEEEL